MTWNLISWMSSWFNPEISERFWESWSYSVDGSFDKSLNGRTPPWQIGRGTVEIGFKLLSAVFSVRYWKQSQTDNFSFMTLRWPKVFMTRWLERIKINSVLGGKRWYCRGYLLRAVRRLTLKWKLQILPYFYSFQLFQSIFGL